MDEKVLLDSIRYYNPDMQMALATDGNGHAEKVLIVTHGDGAVSLQWCPDQEKPDTRIIGDYVYRIRQAFVPLKDRLPGDMWPVIDGHPQRHF